MRATPSRHRSIAQVAKDLDLTETALREWVHRADVDAGKGPAGALTSNERAELARLRREIKQLQIERDILKKAAVVSTGQCNTSSGQIGSIAEWIDDFYNTQRRHTALGNMSPIKYELACQLRKRRT